MNEITNQEVEKIGCLPYVLGALSFIPMVGVIFGIIVIVLGVTKRRIGGIKLILIGVLGILFTVGLYGKLYYEGFVKKEGVYVELRGKLVQSNLNNLVKHIEYYKIQNSKYPDSLFDLAPNENGQSSEAILIYDTMSNPGIGKELPLFHYELINGGSNYYLFSSGIDEVPFTSDDIHPKVSKDEMEKIGYTIKQ
ncbi:MAG: type II secretion system protein G [Proteobacteria bacterium]|nr:type II secretion system protein G [Pseudomonadota bacterium]